MKRQEASGTVARQPTTKRLNSGDSIPDSTTLRNMRRKLLAWYKRHARDLPWRRTRDPYRVWISEIMLQQTTVKAVVGYYERFFDAFPTLESLAEASEDRVLRLWEGLGYYSRARNIHRTARELARERQGKFPTDVESLTQLPGIGRYTAGAIVSFAFDKPAPIVEANTLRLYSRLLGYRCDPRSAAGQELLWTFAERILPHVEPGRLNHALMDLGATICTPRAPNCEHCPLIRECTAFRDGTQDEIPRAKARIEPTDLVEAAVVVRRGNSILLMQRPAGVWWAGLWDFPRFAVDLPDRKSSRNLKLISLPAAAKRSLERTVGEHIGLEIELGNIIAEMKHTVTRYRIRLTCVEAEYLRGELPSGVPMQWVAPARLGELALSTTGRRLAELLQRLQ